MLFNKKSITVKYVILPIVLLFAGAILSIVYFLNSDLNLKVLSHNESKYDIRNDDGIIKGEFTASDNYLGIISLRFNNKEIIYGNSVFRIKNILDSSWYYTATISATQYSTVPFYAFGFPIIKNSKNNTYKFEVKLNSSRKELSIGSYEPILVSRYIYPQKELLKNANLLVKLVKTKVVYYLYSAESWKIICIYSIPLVAYLFYLIFESKLQTISYIDSLKRETRFVLSPYMLFVLLSMLIDVFAMKGISTGIIGIIILLYAFCLVTYNIKPRFSYYLALLYLFFCPFLLSAGMEWVTKKSAIWVYIFLVVGTVHTILNQNLIFEKINKKKVVIAFTKFLRNFILQIDQKIIRMIQKVNVDKIFFRKRPRSITGQILYIIELCFFIIFVVFVFAIATFIAIKTYVYVGDLQQKKTRSLQNPIIKTIEPDLVYKATKVVLYGKNFGWNKNDQLKLLSDNENIVTDLWTDTKIIFTVPLHWKPGYITLLIKKPITWDGEKITATSEKKTIKLLRRTGKMNKDDDAYFEQLKTLSPETLQINGYE